MSVRFINADVFDGLAQIEADSVDSVVTSPPYWGLRSYLPDAHPDKPKEIGQERTLGEHLDVMIRVFEAVKRTMKPEGTLWLNYGDCYATTPNGRSALATKEAENDDRTFRDRPFSTIGGVLKRKDLCMIPNRLAIALQEAGWWVRSEIVWGKPNAMPDSSGRYRPSTSHEKIFLLTKSADSYYDAAAVKMPPAETSIARWAQDIEGQAGSARANGGVRSDRPMKAVGGPLADKQRGHSRRHAGFNDCWDGRLLRNWEPDLSPIIPPEVWEIACRGYKGAHFATFPPALAATCIMAGCPENGTVLDPFGGVGTTAMVADRLGRNAISIELHPDHHSSARARVEKDAGLFFAPTPERGAA